MFGMDFVIFGIPPGRNVRAFFKAMEPANDVGAALERLALSHLIAGVSERSYSHSSSSHDHEFENPISKPDISLGVQALDCMLL